MRHTPRGVLLEAWVPESPRRRDRNYGRSYSPGYNAVPKAIRHLGRQYGIMSL